MSDNEAPVMFENPPVIEAALCAVFKPISALRALHFGVFWQKIRADYPATELQPPILHQVEQFVAEPGRASQQQPFLFPFPFGEDNSRYYFVSGDKSRVVQLQRDRFVINWRKTESSRTYPEYKKQLRTTFEQRWQDFSDFLSENQIAPPEIEQCEITYVNSLRHGEGWNSLADLPLVLAPWSGRLNDPSAPTLEGLNLNAVFLIPENRGRVYINFVPALVPDGSQMNLQLAITARVVPSVGQAPDLLQLLDLAHQWGVKSFAAFTSEQMHQRWGRK